MSQTHDFQRVLRTPSSERYLVKTNGVDIAALDIHFVPDGTVQATLIILNEQYASQDSVNDLLRLIDEALLPQVTLESEKLVFTVCVGRVIGAFTPDADNNRDTQRN